MTDIEEKNILTKKSVVFFLMFIACFLWGSAFSCVKIGYEKFGIDKSNPASLMLFAGARYIIAGLLLLIPGLLIKKNDFILNKNRLKSISVNSIFQVLGQYTFYYIGIAKTPGSRAAIINSTTVFISIFLAALVFRKEKYTVLKALSSIMAVISVVVLNMNRNFELGFDFMSDGFILLASFCAAVAVCLQSDLTKCITPASLCAYSFLFGGVIFGSIGLVGGGAMYFSRNSILLLLYLSFISSAAFTIQGTLLKYNKVSDISIYRIMNPIIGFVLSTLLLDGERKNLFSINTLISLVIMVSAILILRLGDRKRLARTPKGKEKP